MCFMRSMRGGFIAFALVACIDLKAHFPGICERFSA
jgi:hypothetical protein